MKKLKLAKLTNNGNRVTESVPKPPIRLDLGCGPNKKVGFTGVDTISFPNIDVCADLRQKWPWEDNSIEEVHSSHFIEHLTAPERVHFWNELYRVLKPDAKATIIAPHWSSCRAYGDPTHQWPPMCEFALFYLRREWREVNAPHDDIRWSPSGYNCHFDFTCGFSLEPVTALKHQEAQQFAMTYYKEACQDMIATVTKK